MLPVVRWELAAQWSFAWKLIHEGTDTCPTQLPSLPPPVSSDENDGSCLEASRFCGVDYVSDHFAFHPSTDVWELGQEISSIENGGKCLEASRFCCVDCMFLIVLPSILQMSSMLQMCASWGRRSTVMGTVSHALEGCTERAMTCPSFLPPWLGHAHSGGHVSAGLLCWSVNRFFELKKQQKT